MKASTSKLGLAIQLFLLRQGVSLEQLARETDLNADSLSNLIHGRRRFKDDTLRRLADSSLFKRGHFSYKKLRALKALDDYAFDELVLALLEGSAKGRWQQRTVSFSSHYAMSYRANHSRMSFKKSTVLFLN